MTATIRTVKDKFNLKSETMKEIINEISSFNILGLVKGTVNIVVSDNGTDQFPCVVNVHSNKGNGSTNLTLSGNGTINQKVAGISAKAVISGWDCTPDHLRCHVKVTVSKSIIKNKTVFDKDLYGKRG